MSAIPQAPLSEGPFSCDEVNVLRVLAMDAVQKANSGHPGMPMGMAEIAAVLWRRHLRHNPANPQWPDRDRFVLSNGHGSMLLYALLHLSGYELPMAQLARFRQLHSRTPGHPELGVTPGVETTTGPLGQGLSNAVGMAIAAQVLARQFNRPGLEIVAHNTYVFVGDGCLMEGISHEACSLAGTLGLGRLIVFYDDNGISIDGQVRGWFTDDTPKRFEAYGWHVVAGVDGHDREAIDRAIRTAQAVTDRPSLICCRTVIANGAPTKAGTHESHGAPLGEAEISATRQKLGWPSAPFEVPPQVYEAWDARGAGQAAEQAWNRTFARYASEYPREASEFQRRMRAELPSDFPVRVKELLSSMQKKAAGIASRKASQETLEALAPALPELIGGSADLAGSNLTLWSGSQAVTRERGGSYIHYGVREFGMAAIMNGLALHGGFIPYGGTFLTFSDYCRNAIRMAALMRVRSIFVLTHDSIGLGEDGPTHQPIEHVASLRLIPNVTVWRPCDSQETAVAWAAGIERHDGPTCLILSRQNLPFQQRTPGTCEAVRRGGYVLADAPGAPAAVILATGSEVALAIAAQHLLSQRGIAVRVVSMPCTSVFDSQSREYRESVLPASVPRVAVEAGVSDYWYKYVGLGGAIIGIDRFGESAPAGELFRLFGLTGEHVAEATAALLEARRAPAEVP